MGLNIIRAVSTFIGEGNYQYARTGSVLGESFRVQVLQEIEKINDGVGDEIIQEVLDWVRRVRVRALQDLAVCHPMDFNRAWCSVEHQIWTEIAPSWTRVLRKREENDVGWVPTMDFPTWNPVVSALRLRILEKISEVGETITSEDKTYWEACARELCSTEGDPPKESVTLIGSEEGAEVNDVEGALNCDYVTDSPETDGRVSIVRDTDVQRDGEDGLAHPESDP